MATLPRMRFIKLSGEELGTIEPFDVVLAEFGETPVTLPQIMALKEKCLAWRCCVDGSRTGIMN